MRLCQVCLSFILALSVCGGLYAEEHGDMKKGAAKAELLCPVSGKPASLTHKVSTAEGPVFFCCDNCPKKFEADPAKYKAKVAEQQAVLAHYPKVQEVCPISGKPIDKSVFVENEGQKVFFCCKDCAGKYKEDPAKYKAKVMGTYKYLDLPKCPISGEPIDVTVKLASDEGPVYFCCGGCEKKYKADAAKYKDQVAAQRTTLAAMPSVQVTCPISGKPINSKKFVEKDGAKTYFCCDDCKSAYEKDPAKYTAKLASAVTYQTQCPVMGETVDPKAYVDLEGGKRVYFCCPGCKEKLLANPDKYLTNLEIQHVHVDASKVKEAGK